VSAPFRDAGPGYAARGLAVLPLARRGKAPLVRLVPHGKDSATTDAATVEAWALAAPDANVGIACARSEIVALDVDDRRGGHDSLDGLERQHGELPPTWEALTGGGGRHLYFRHPGGEFRGEVAPGVEVKAEHYVVAPPSVHPSGHRYEWSVDGHPDEVEVAELPVPWRERIVAPSRAEVPTASADRGDDALLAIPAATYIEALCGRTPDHRGYVRCPFHSAGEERTPSLRPYGDGGWACFACPPRPGAGRRCLGGTIYTFAGLLWGYSVPLRGPAFLVVQTRLLDVMTEYLLARRAA
jgi:hypothetical protein